MLIINIILIVENFFSQVIPGSNKIFIYKDLSCEQVKDKLEVNNKYPINFIYYNII